MTEHELVSCHTLSGTKLEGSVDFKEVKCQGKYILVGFGQNYCPHCGEEL